MHVITVWFTVKPEHLEDFLPAMRANAERSLGEEPGCLQFDVCQDPGDPGSVFLYEVYQDEDAFRVHLDSPHFRVFDAEVAPWLAGKEVRPLRRLAP